MTRMVSSHEFSPWEFSEDFMVACRLELIQIEKRGVSWEKLREGWKQTKHEIWPWQSQNFVFMFIDRK